MQFGVDSEMDEIASRAYLARALAPSVLMSSFISCMWFVNLKACPVILILDLLHEIRSLFLIDMIRALQFIFKPKAASAQSVGSGNRSCGR